MSGYSTAAGAARDPYVRWKAQDYTSPVGKFLRKFGVGAKAANQIGDSARGIGKISIVAGAIDAGYQTYEHDAFYDDDPARSVSGFAKARHVFTSSLLTTGFAAGGAMTGGSVGAGAAVSLTKNPLAAAAGQPIGAILGGYTGGRVGSAIAIEINAKY